MPMLWILFLVPGLALAALAVWLRMGRSEGARSWVGTPQFERTVLVTLPAVAVVLLALAAGHAAGTGTVREVAALVAGLAVLSVLVWNVFGAPIPRWSLPRWYVARTAHRRTSRRPARRRPRRAS